MEKPGEVSEDTILKNRLLFDTRPLKKCIRRFQTFKRLVEVGRDETAWRPQLDQFLVDLETFQYGLVKHQLVHDMNRRELDNYKAEQRKIEQDITRTTQEIEELKGDLEAEQVVRKNKLQYDEIAKDINKLPSRARSIENAKVLKNDIRVLEAEKRRLLAAMDLRRNMFATVMQALNTMKDTIAADNDAVVEDNTNADGNNPTVARASSQESIEVIVEEEEEGAVGADGMDTT
ncbi:hypothetical protein HK101_004499 [Irineochytrium annulatum]|nr:hypothetical protein HK101_004499 [Irineochytrium annulatum]